MCQRQPAPESPRWSLRSARSSPPSTASPTTNSTATTSRAIPQTGRPAPRLAGEAAGLGLAGPVYPLDFNAVLEGRVSGEPRLGRQPAFSASSTSTTSSAVRSCLRPTSLSPIGVPPCTAAISPPRSSIASGGPARWLSLRLLAWCCGVQRKGIQLVPAASFRSIPVPASVPARMAEPQRHRACLCSRGLDTKGGHCETGHQLFFSCFRPAGISGNTRHNERNPHVHIGKTGVTSVIVASFLITSAALSAASSDRAALSLPGLSRRSRDHRELFRTRGGAEFLGDMVLALAPRRNARCLLTCKSATPTGASSSSGPPRTTRARGGESKHSLTRKVSRFRSGRERQPLTWSGLDSQQRCLQPRSSTRRGASRFRIVGVLKRRQIVRRLEYLLSGRRGAEPKRFIDSIPDVTRRHEDGGLEHEAGEDHAHGGVGMEGASLVPS